MSYQLGDQLTIEAEVHLPLATTQLVQVHSGGPTDLLMMDRDSYWLDLCLTPRRYARARFPDHWGPQRYKRLGKVFFLPPGEPVEISAAGGPAEACVVCHIRPKTMLEWSQGEIRWTDRRLEAGLDIPAPNIRGQLQRLGEEMRAPGFASETMIELITSQLVLELARYFGNFIEAPPNGELTPWRLRLIDERLRDVCQPPTLTELAELCRLSVRQLTRGFRASHGCSIGDYIAGKRIDEAKRLLAADLGIKAVAYTLGFASPSGFCIAFRRATGKTPGEFRREASRRGSLTH